MTQTAAGSSSGSSYLESRRGAAKRRPSTRASSAASTGATSSVHSSTELRSVSEVTSAPSMPHGTTRSNRSEEHTSELQSRGHLVCRLLLEKKKHDTTNTKS